MKLHLALRRLTLTALLFAMPVFARASIKDLPEGWLTNWEQALAKAKSENKPILAVFSAEWCGPCQMMIKEVYPKPDFRKMIESWVPVYLDDAQDPKTHEKFQIEGYPTFVMLSSEGVEEDRFVGGMMEQEFIKRVTTGSVLTKRAAAINAELLKTPENAALLKELGDIQIKLDDTHSAIESYRKAAKLDPEDKVGVADDLYIFDNIPDSDEEVEPALAKFAAFEKTYPKSDRIELAAYFHAQILLFLDRIPDAVKVLDDAIARFPEGDFTPSMVSMATALKAQIAPPTEEQPAQ